MCGIAGFVSLDGPRDPDRLARLGARMTTALRHRGPDGHGVHVSADGRVMLGATRLAVRDLSGAGDQPMRSPDGHVTLVYNGELYRDRNATSRPPWPLRSRCDTEEFLRVVHERGESGLSGLDGMFAAAWHDRRDGRVVLARDHFGVKPLVWTRVDGGLLFASEISALLASGLPVPDVDPLTFLHRAHVRMDAVDEETWISGIHALQPAHVLVVDGASVRQHRFWAPRPAEEPVPVERLAEAFREAVSIRRPSDVPMAAVVSGGVDSSAVFGALRRLDCDVTPYVVRYEGADPGQNEDVPYALEVARAAGREPVVCDIRVDDVADLTARVAPHLQRPFLHGAELALFRTYERIAADRRTVVFSGHGSDELWGYQEGRYFPIADPARPPDTHSEYYLKNRLYRDERPVWHRMLDELGAQLGVREQDVTELVWERTLAPYRELRSLDPHKRGRHHLMRRFLVYVNEMVDACSSAFSLEDRPSFQDVTLAELAFGMPEYVKNREGPGRTKPFLKQALRDLVPASVLSRPKKGFPAPGDTAFRDRLADLVRDTGLPYDLRLSPELLGDLGTGELMFLYSAQVWFRQIQVRPPDPEPIRVLSQEGGRGPVWTHQTLADAKDLPDAPPALSPEQAQPWCNFVVWTPERVPDGCELVTGTLRKESPPGRAGESVAGRTPWSENNPAAYRFEVAGPGRRLRIKEFLYDWAFPALDQPCLWESATYALEVDDRSVVWFGVDYMKKRAASARIARTTIELSVMEGEFSDEEILDLYRSLRPADATAAETIAGTSFAVLSYWARRPEAAKITVPIGLYKFRRRRAHESDWRTGTDAEREVSGLGLPATLGGLALDAAARFRDDEGREEVEAVYAGGPDRGRELRVIAQKQGCGSIEVPAEPEEDQPGERTQVQVGGADVQLGWIDERHGPFQAVFASEGREVMLLSSTGPGLGRDWFLAALTEIVG